MSPPPGQFERQRAGRDEGLWRTGPSRHGGWRAGQKAKELNALALGAAARCDPCIGYHAQALVKLGVTRQELDAMLGVVVYMGGGPALMYAASAIAAFEEFSG